MAASTGASFSLRSRPQQLHRSFAASSIHGARSVSLSAFGRNSLSFRSRPRFGCLQVSCAAKAETVDQVIGIVRKQLALPEGSKVSKESKFSDLGADSLDTVEIVMGLEEAFGISVEEDSAQNIVTVEDVAKLIDDLVAKNSAKKEG